MMIEIRYTPPYELDIAGRFDELESIRRRILEMPESRNNEIVLEADASIDPAPYEFALPKLTIAEGRGSAKVTVCDGMGVRVEGSREALEEFAAFCYFEPDVQEGAHSHYDYDGAGSLIDPESIPLVISIKR